LQENGSRHRIQAEDVSKTTQGLRRVPANVRSVRQPRSCEARPSGLGVDRDAADVAVVAGIAAGRRSVRSPAHADSHANANTNSASQNAGAVSASAARAQSSRNCQPAGGIATALAALVRVRADLIDVAHVL